MVSRPAEAGKTTGGSPIWELPRSPFVPHPATPSALECELDGDDDGLDDEIEGLLAERYVPVIRFATGESHRESGAAAWVESEQSGPYRARVLSDGRVEVAWLAQ